MVIPPQAGIWSRNQNRNSNNGAIRRNLTPINFAQGKLTRTVDEQKENGEARRRARSERGIHPSGVSARRLGACAAQGLFVKPGLVADLHVIAVGIEHLGRVIAGDPTAAAALARTFRRSIASCGVVSSINELSVTRCSRDDFLHLRTCF